MDEGTVLLVWGIMAHLAADWLFQDDWMAMNKSSLRHPGAWVHGLIHAAFMWLVFPIGIAVLIGFIHIFIDTRIPLRWWMKHIKRVEDGPHVAYLEVWVDQVLHILVLAVVVLVFY